MLQESEVQRLSGAEAASKRLQSQLEEADLRERSRENTTELLRMDKAYLTKEVELLSDRLRKTESELSTREEKVAELKKARQELYQKLYETEAASRDQVGGCCEPVRRCGAQHMFPACR